MVCKCLNFGILNKEQTSLITTSNTDLTYCKWNANEKQLLKEIAHFLVVGKNKKSNPYLKPAKYIIIQDYRASLDST